MNYFTVLLNLTLCGNIPSSTHQLATILFKINEFIRTVYHKKGAGTTMNFIKQIPMSEGRVQRLRWNLE